jgi:uncharacterized membrane protein
MGTKDVSSEKSEERRADGAAKSVKEKEYDEAVRSSLSELTKRNVEIVAELEKGADAERSATDRLADAISRFVGSMKFVYIHIVWFALWIAASSLPFIPAAWRIDPFPFTFLTFVVSLEAIFLSTFILISQNHEERVARRRNHLDLQINLLSEQENSQMLKMLDSIQQHLQIGSDPTAQALQEATRPEAMVAQIKTVIEKGE